MSRRSTPERLDEARRAATRNRLTGDGMTPVRADEWIARWDVRAVDEGLKRDGAYWDACYRWIVSQRR